MADEHPCQGPGLVNPPGTPRGVAEAAVAAAEQEESTSRHAMHDAEDNFADAKRNFNDVWGVKEEAANAAKAAATEELLGVYRAQLDKYETLLKDRHETIRELIDDNMELRQELRALLPFLPPLRRHKRCEVDRATGATSNTRIWFEIVRTPQEEEAMWDDDTVAHA
jgi:hypothetical protein